MEGAAEGKEVGAMVEGTAVVGDNEGDADGEVVVDVKVSTIAPFPPGD